MAGPKYGGSSEWITVHLPGIFQGLMAAMLGGGLLPGLQIGWERFFHRRLPSAAEGPLANGVAALVLVPTVWLLARPLSRLAAHRLLGKTPAIKGDRFSVYVAHFGDDEVSATVRDRVIASIRAELGTEAVEVLPAGLLLRLADGVSDDVAAAEASEKARTLLRKTHGDLLIWGKVYLIPGEKAKLDLRFVSAKQERSGAELFGFTDRLTLDSDFAPEMGAALAAVVSSLAFSAARSEGRMRYSAKSVVPVAERLSRLIRGLPASLRADDRGMLFFCYGLIQQTVGNQSGQSERLEEAVDAFREALLERTRERVPLDWATTQDCLGNALLTLGGRESGTERLEEAISAFHNALLERARDRVPVDWVTTQINLGAALTELGERDGGTEKLSAAAAVSQEALRGIRRDQLPVQWAFAQGNLATALAILGERASGTDLLNEAVGIYRDALRDPITIFYVPLERARIQVNLGAALTKLGERQNNTESLKEALDIIESALKKITRERVPLEWGKALNHLGDALAAVGERENTTKRLQAAVATQREALREVTRERVPLHWATTQASLGVALTKLGRKKRGPESLEEAVTAFREAMLERTPQRVPVDWAKTQNSLGEALLALGERESGTAKLGEAAKAYREALEVLMTCSAPHHETIARSGLKRATEILEARTRDQD